MGDGAFKGFGICMIICVLVLALPLGITNIVLSQTEDGECDHRDTIGLNIKEYLLIGGIVSVSVATLMAFFGILSICLGSELTAIPIMVLTVLNILFGIAFFIIGAVILFRSNIECIHEGSVPVIYALVLWCLSASSCFMNH